MLSLKKLNLLFLENNREFAENMIETLNLYFDTIYHSLTIKNAIEYFHDQRVDVIISDIKVDDGNGLEFIRKVRVEDKHIPIIILSAYKDEAFLFDAIEFQILSYELKPLSYSGLLKVLDKLDKVFNSNKVFQIEEEIFYDFLTQEIELKNKKVVLTKKEILFINLLFKYPHKVLSYELIQKDVWEDTPMSISALKNFILRFRKKTGITKLVSLPNRGYKLNSNEKV
jgi:DNA-binding response OmpR family regulator